MDVSCLNCGNTSKDLVYLKCVYNGEEKYVCVRCLPMLIHGQH